MALDFQEFWSLRTLLEWPSRGEGASQEDGPKSACEHPGRSRVGPWTPKTLADAIEIVGIMGWDAMGAPGDFTADSAEAQEALQALARYQGLLDEAAHDSEVLQAAACGVDRRSQAFWGVLPEGGPLERYGWDEPGFPALHAIAAGTLKPSRKQDLANTRKTDQQIIGALASAVLRQSDFPAYQKAPTPAELAQDIEIWAKARGIRHGLGAKTVKIRLEAALSAVAKRK